MNPKGEYARLDEVRRRTEAATPGEWHAVLYADVWELTLGAEYASPQLLSESDVGEREAKANAEFAAAARLDVPLLLAAVEERDGIIADMMQDGGRYDAGVREVRGQRQGHGPRGHRPQPLVPRLPWFRQARRRHARPPDADGRGRRAGGGGVPGRG